MDEQMIADIESAVTLELSRQAVNAGSLEGYNPRKLARAAHSVIAGKVAELTWRPIESAPKDEWMLVFIPAEDSDMGQIHAARNMKIANGHTMIVGHHFVSDLAGKPSHWMPLPTPPALAPYPERRSE